MYLQRNGMMTNETKAQALGKTHWLKHKKQKHNLSKRFRCQICSLFDCSYPICLMCSLCLCPFPPPRHTTTRF
jgi:hypothetical protein